MIDNRLKIWHRIELPQISRQLSTIENCSETNVTGNSLTLASSPNTRHERVSCYANTNDMLLNEANESMEA